MVTPGKIRNDILKMITSTSSPHIGTCLSIVDILYVLYFRILRVDPSNPEYEKRDKFILSKGHGSAALYATLAERGFFPMDYLSRYYVDGGVLPAHLDMCSVPGIEVSTGSLGHGLSIGVGMAIANKQQGNDGKIYVLLGDGECNEGSVWEAIMLAATIKLDNIIAIVDYNKLQGLGYTNEIIDQKNMKERWEAFGWKAVEVDGHNLDDLLDVFTLKHSSPLVIIAHTVKGKGISYMENDVKWHYRSPDKKEFVKALRELRSNI
ncbi:transketolase [Bacillus thuringiensis]|uniref:transketolase n=1 Tax=Bacillus thuringiensis TaxID=1428 RepID=UPI0011A37D35|nr:transketolase [Bacillus thuringiensis]